MAARVALRPASTVILVREQAGAFAVYLTQRSRKSPFMGGNYVFPGGKVDAGDQDTAFWAHKGDISREAAVRRFHDASEELALLAYAVAAIRETWEEAGVLLADLARASDGLLARFLAAREEMAPHGDWLRSHLVGRGGLLAYSALWPWSHWITPTAMKARFDTRFFIAFLPAGQSCRPDSRETVEGRWMTPREALVANEQGRVNLSPPTLVTLHGLLAYETLSDLEAALPCSGWGPALMPKMLFPPVGPMIIQTWDPDYAVPEKTLPPEKNLPEDEESIRRLPVGAPFSRLWNDKGTWRPVA